MMMKNKKGQMFIALIIFTLAFLIFIFAAPTLSQVITESASTQGTATSFVMKSFLWIIVITLIAVFLRIITGGGGFFA